MIIHFSVYKNKMGSVLNDTSLYLQKQLDELGLKQVPTEGSGDCMFQALRYQLFKNKKYWSSRYDYVFDTGPKKSKLSTDAEYGNVLRKAVIRKIYKSLDSVKETANLRGRSSFFPDPSHVDFNYRLLSQVIVDYSTWGTKTSNPLRSLKEPYTVDKMITTMEDFLYTTMSLTSTWGSQSILGIVSEMLWVNILVLSTEKNHTTLVRPVSCYNPTIDSDEIECLGNKYIPDLYVVINHEPEWHYTSTDFTNTTRRIEIIDKFIDRGFVLKKTTSPKKRKTPPSPRKKKTSPPPKRRKPTSPRKTIKPSALHISHHDKLILSANSKKNREALIKKALQSTTRKEAKSLEKNKFGNLPFITWS